MQEHVFSSIYQKIKFIYNKTISNKTNFISYIYMCDMLCEKKKERAKDDSTTAIYYFCLSNIFAWIIGCVIPDFVIFLVLCQKFIFHISLKYNIRTQSDAFPPKKYNRKSYNAIRKLCSYMIYILNPTFCRTHTHSQYISIFQYRGRKSR